MSHLFCFGFGFSARALAETLRDRGWKITGTSRSSAGCKDIRNQGFDAVQFDGIEPVADNALATVTHLLSSVPPRPDGDPVLLQCSADIQAHARHFDWVGYLSTTGVYGDRVGGWVDEASDLTPSTTRGQRRVTAEKNWLDMWPTYDLPVHVFRLAGIYGPGRNQLEAMKNGTARRLVKPGQVFSRIHVDDIVGILTASISAPNPGQIYNVCDDEAAPPQDVVTYAASLLNLQPPPEEKFDGADLSEMARSFYSESKLVSNARVKNELGYEFTYPDYRSGLKALL